MIKLFSSLKKGNSLPYSEILKSAQNVVNLSSTLIPFIAVIYPPAQVIIDTNVLVKLYAAIGGINMYLVTATTNKIGL